MSRSEDWYKQPGNHEYFIHIPSPKYEQRIRVRMIKECISKTSKKKKVKTFSVGLEINLNQKWYTIIRHCNYHEHILKKFHTHNSKRLDTPWGKERRIIQQNRKKIPGSQLRWGITNIIKCYNRYTKSYLAYAKRAGII